MLRKEYYLLFAPTVTVEESDDLKRVEVAEPEQVGTIRAFTESRARKKANKLLKKHRLDQFGFFMLSPVAPYEAKHGDRH